MLRLLSSEVDSEWTAWDAMAHFRWDGPNLSVLMESEAPPCGRERGFAPMTYGLVSRVSDAQRMQNSSVVVFIGDIMHDCRLKWTVKAVPCLAPTVTFTLVDDWNCAILAPTPMEVHFENGHGNMKQVVDEVVALPDVPWNKLSNQIFWRGAHHMPETCARLLPSGMGDPRAYVVGLSERTPWLNASFASATRSTFLQHRYMLDIAGSTCATCVRLAPAFPRAEQH